MEQELTNKAKKEVELQEIIKQLENEQQKLVDTHFQVFVSLKILIHQNAHLHYCSPPLQAHLNNLTQ